jgi:hypothetical protein
MDQGSSVIERQIEEQRERLHRNLNELESTVKSKLDWHAYYDKNPWACILIAFSGGVVISSLSGSMSHDRDPDDRTGWGRLGTAILALGSQTARDYLGSVMPGLTRVYDALEPRDWTRARRRDRPDRREDPYVGD